jgi:hypothetical protein
LLTLGTKGVVDIWDISNLDNVVLIQAYYLDNGDPSLKIYDYLSSLSGSTQFIVSLHYAPEYSIKRFDYSISSPDGIVSLPKEFENVNGSGVEFLHQFISSEKDEHDDMIIAYTRDSVTNPSSPSIRLYTFQK